MFIVNSRMRRALGFAAALVALAIPSTLLAGAVHPAAHTDVTAEVREPFGTGALLPFGGLPEKWRTVWRQWNDERQLLAACREDRDQCQDPAALEFLSIVDNARALTGRARLGEINRAINLAIRPVSDLAAHGSIDVWSSPLATIARRSGDCEDYAIAKFAALIETGVPPEHLRLLIVRDSARAEDHAVVAVRHDDNWLVLDNRRLLMLADTQLGSYAPMVLLGSDDVGRHLEVPVASLEQGSRIASMVEPAGIAE